MKQLAIVVIVLVAFLAVLKYGGEKALTAYGKKTRIQVSGERVNNVLGNLSDHGVKQTAHFMEAACMWARGKIIIRNKDDLETAELGFIAWLHETGMYRQIGSYEIAGTEFAEDGTGVIVTCKIEGQTRRFLVEEEKPLRFL